MLQKLKTKIASVTSIKKMLLLLCAAFILTFTVGTTAAYVFTGTPSLINIFTNGLKPDGDLIIQKNMTHPFGENYTVPDHIAFQFEVNLGTVYANETVKTTQGEVTADANGVITLNVPLSAAISGRAAVFDIEEGTAVTVKEVQIATGFTVDTESQEITIIKYQDNIVSFTNQYVPAPADASELTVAGTKSLSGRDWQPGDSFTFDLSVKAGEGWTSLGTRTIVYEQIENMSAPEPDFDKFDFSDLIQGYAFSNAGTYTFRVSETEGTIGGITYDKAVSTFEVLVGDADMDGFLEIQAVSTGSSANTTVTGTASEGFTVNIAFENKYAPEGSADVYINIDKILEDTSGQNKSPAGFTFELYDENSNLEKTSETTDSVGETSIHLVFEPENAGNTFTYILKETNAGQKVGALNYDHTEYKLQVAVVDNLDGTVSAYISDYQEAAVTENDGESMQESAVTESSTEPVQESVATEGNADPMQEAAAEDGVESVQESAVTESSTELVKASIPADATNTYQATFTNTYDPADTSVTINGSKFLSGRGINVGEFTFNLYETGADFIVAEGAQPMCSAVNSAAVTGDGANNNGTNSGQTRSTFGFESLQFSTVGSRYFVVREDDSAALGGITYDGARYLITVNITDEAGELKAVTKVTDAYGVSVDISDITFTNTYKAAAVNLPLGGRKLLHGDTLKEGMFRFLLYTADENYATQGEAFQKVTNSETGTFAFTDLVFGSAGTYRYVITEDDSDNMEGMTYDDTVYYLTVQVTDPGDGHLTISGLSMTADGQTVTEIFFENTYIEPDKPTEPSEPSEPSEPTEPSEPSEPSKPTDPSKPSDPGDPGSTEESTETTEQEDVPVAGGIDTGDGSNILVYLVVAALSGVTAVIVLIAVWYKKRKHK